MSVDDITKLGSGGPLSVGHLPASTAGTACVVYRQRLGESAAKPVEDAGWKGNELIAVRVHLPSRIRYHNAGAGNLKRGNILVWEQSLADRQAGKPLEIEARIEQTSILSSTLMLFAVSGLLALLVLAAIIWWVVRKGRRAARRARRLTPVSPPTVVLLPHHPLPSHHLVLRAHRPLCRPRARLLDPRLLLRREHPHELGA